MTITHHLDDATILAFASGTLAEAHSIVAASHISGCAVCRSSLQMAETLGGGLLAAQNEEAVSDLCRSATLASLDAVISTKPAKLPKSELPSALTRALDGKSLKDIQWKKKAPGVSVFNVPLEKGSKTQLRLLSIAKGRALPEHGHGGDEITLVLKGSYHDHMGRYSPGDVADLDGDIEHQPVADSDH